MTASPNILFLFSDQHRWDWIGCEHRVPVRTPNIDALAARGTRFTQCRANAPMCGPSRACLATGLRYEQTGVPSNRTKLDPTRPTFMKQLRDVGYRVVNLGKCDLHKPSREFGPDGWAPVHGRLGFTDACDHAGKRDAAITYVGAPADEPYSQYLQSLGLLVRVQQDQAARQEQIKTGGGIPARPYPVAREHQIDDFTGRLALERIAALPREAPWFMQINWGSPHAPFDAAEELANRYHDVDFPDPIAPDPDDPTDHQAVRRQYAAMIEGMDEWIGRVIDAVAQRGELERTIIVYSSDHGEMLGDHGQWNKGQSYEGSVHVPLVMAGPGVAKQARCDHPVELIDLGATFCEWAGTTLPAGCATRSFARCAADPHQPHRDVALASHGQWRMITDGTWKLVRQRDGSQQLFNLTEDAAERHDVADAQRDTMRDLSHRLDAELDAPTSASPSSASTSTERR